MVRPELRVGSSSIPLWRNHVVGAPRKRTKLSYRSGSVDRDCRKIKQLHHPTRYILGNKVGLQQVCRLAILGAANERCHEMPRGRSASYEVHMVWCGGMDGKFCKIHCIHPRKSLVVLIRNIRNRGLVSSGSTNEGRRVRNLSHKAHCYQQRRTTWMDGTDAIPRCAL